MERKSRKSRIGWIAGSVIGLGTMAMAAGLTVVVSGVVASGTGTGTTCQSTKVEATLGNTAWSKESKRFVQDKVTLSGVNPECKSSPINVAILDKDGNALSVATETATGSTTQVVKLEGPVLSEDISDISVAIG